MTKTDRIKALLVASVMISLIVGAGVKIYFQARDEIAHDTAIERKIETVESIAVEATTEATEAKREAETSRKLFNFVLDHPDAVIFTADRHGKILNVDGDVKRWGMDKDDITGTGIEMMRPPVTRIAYRMAYMSRIGSSDGGQVRFFDNETLIGGKGLEYRVDGAVYWHDQRGVYVAMIAESD